MKSRKTKSEKRFSSADSIRKSKPSLISNLSINQKMTGVFLVLVFLSCFVFFAMIKTVTKEEEKRKDDTENTIIIAAEQYINTSVDYIVNIAKAVYTNSTLYSFLDTEFKSNSEYYSAFHNLQSNNSLIVTESNYIKNYNIYTSNDTILEGGNIFSLSKVTDEEWYKEFKRLNKPIIIYCDRETQELSLIRNMDYYPLNRGNAILKINFQNNALQSYFSNLDFEGRLYVMYSGTPIFSNVQSSDPQYGVIDTDYTCIISNYYTAELEYYAYVETISYAELMKKNYIYGIMYVIFLIISILISFIVSRNIAVRIRRLEKFMSSDEPSRELYKIYPGRDEIGRLYSSFIKSNDKLKQTKKQISSLEAENEAVKETRDSFRLSAYKLDSILTVLREHPDVINNKGVVYGSDVPLSIEIEKMKIMEKDAVGGDLEIAVKGDIPGECTIPVASASLIADDLLSCRDGKTGESSNHRRLKVTFEAGSDTGSFNITWEGNFGLSSAKLLKLRAIFEGDGEGLGDNFVTGYTYNPYIRLKLSLKENISADIKENGDSFRMILSFINSDKKEEDHDEKK